MQSIKKEIASIAGDEKLNNAIEEFNNMTPKERVELQVKWANEALGDRNLEDGIECDICNNKGYVTYCKEVKGKYFECVKDCVCLNRRKQILRAKNSGLGDYLDKRSKDYKVDSDWQQNIKEKLVTFCQEHSEDNQWFSIVGAVGCGKTLVGSIISNHLLFNVNRNVQYVTWTDFISKLKRDMMGEKTNMVSDYLESIKQVDVLFLDEVLKKYNDTDLKYLMEIINYRYTNNLKTLITSERVIDNLLDIDEATFSRMVEKSGEYFINIPKDRNKNFRLKKVQNIN